MNKVQTAFSRFLHVGGKATFAAVAVICITVSMAVSMFAALSINDSHAAAVGVSTQDNTCNIGSSAIAQCFPDPNLAAMIAEITTGQAANTGDPFTQYKIDHTTKIQYGSGKSISNLSGLQYLTNLTYLDLSNNQITDITPLNSLINLQTLDLSGNQISNITPLNRPVNANSPRFGGNGAALETLNLSHNRISDLSPLKLDNATLSSLFNLDLSHNFVTDVAPLASLYNLENLNLSQNHISSLQPFAKTGVNIPLNHANSLDLSDNKITDPQPLKDLTSTSINLANNNISDCSAFRGKGSGDLDLTNNHVSDIRPLHALIANSVLLSSTIALTGNQILDVSSLKDISDIHNVILKNQHAVFPEKTISAASPLLRSSPTSVSLPTAKTKCGTYVAPQNVTPASGVYDPATGTVTWSNLDTSVHQVSLTFDTTIPCPCTPEVQYNGDVSQLLRIEPAPPSPGPGPTPPSTPGPHPSPNPATTPTPAGGSAPPSQHPQPSAATGAKPVLANTGTPVTATIFATFVFAVSGMGIELFRKTQKG